MSRHVATFDLFIPGKCHFQMSRHLRKPQAGAGYEKSNVRVHVYLYASGMPKPNGFTHAVPGFVPVSKVHVQMGDRAAVI